MEIFLHFNKYFAREKHVCLQVKFTLLVQISSKFAIGLRILLIPQNIKFHEKIV